MKKSKMKTNDTNASKNKSSANRINNITRRNKHASDPIANTLKKHLKWCIDPDDRAYSSYGAKGREVDPELMYTNDGPTNQAIIERVIERIGEKPTPIKNYHLHVDWQATEGKMTLGNIAWVTASENVRNKSTNICLESGEQLHEQARKIGLKPTTATARVRSGQSPETALNPQLRADIDFDAQRERHEAIAELIKTGKIFVTTEGQLFIVPETGEPYPRKTSVEKHGYHSITLMLDGQSTRVQFSHVVLIQYAGIPPQQTTGLKTVWHADHIDNNKDNNRPDNLCWLAVTENSGVKKAGGGINNNLEFVKALAKRGLAILPQASLSPYPDDYIESRIAKADSIRHDNSTWKLCVRDGWLPLPETAFIEKIAIRNQHIPSHLLVRLALASGNNAELFDDIAVSCSKTGRQHLLSELSWNCRSSFNYVLFSSEVIDYLTRAFESNDIEHIVDVLPVEAMFEKQSICLRTIYRRHANQDEAAANFIEHDFINAELSKTLLCAAPGAIKSLYTSNDNRAVSPLLISPGSTSNKLSVHCALCGGPTERVTIKSIVRSQKSGEGRLCECCNARSRAANGVSAT